MPFCPKCRAEFEDGFNECGSCGVALVSKIEDLPEPMTPERAGELLKDIPLSVVVRGGVSACKEIANALLNIQIPTVIAPADDVDPRSGIAMILDVLVAEDDLEKAGHFLTNEWKELLEQDRLQFIGIDGIETSTETENEVEEVEEGEPACPACGSTDPLRDGECPNCGLFLGE